MIAKNSNTQVSTEVTEMDRYLFDLNGYLIIRGALSEKEVADCNESLDEMQNCSPGDWHGRVQGHNFTGHHEGLNLQQIYEAGPAWERLIDHPSWIALVTHFIGTDVPNFDGHHGPLFIDENFASIRGPGQAIGLHSGGHERVTRCQFRYHDGRFHCGQINILIAINDVGHGITGAVEVHLNAGDAILFVDAIMHGSARRLSEGQRRIAVYRYGPSWGFFRHPYRPSTELLERLTPIQRSIVLPHSDPQFPN